jgi:hypothetical protein
MMLAGVPRSRERTVGRSRIVADNSRMPDQIALVAAFVAAVSGLCVIRHSKALMHNSIGLQDGGGWTALILVESMISLGAAAFAMS